MNRGRSNGPGVTYRLLTAVEIGTLRALAEGMTPTQLAAETRTKVRAVWRRLYLLRLKLGAFTNDEMMYLVGKKGIIK